MEICSLIGIEDICGRVFCKICASEFILFTDGILNTLSFIWQTLGYYGIIKIKYKF